MNLASVAVGLQEDSEFAWFQSILVSVPLSVMGREACFAFVEIRKIKVVWTIEINTPSVVISTFQGLKVSQRRNLCSV